jgi:hypothetical protein
MKRYFKVSRRRMSNPSRKDYIKVAAILKHARAELAARRITGDAMLDFIGHELADWFQADNERFDRGRFFNAAGIVGKNPARGKYGPRIRRAARTMVKRYGKRRAKRIAGGMISTSKSRRMKEHFVKVRRAINPRRSKIKTYVLQTWDGKQWIDRNSWGTDKYPNTAYRLAAGGAAVYAKIDRVKARVVVK